MQKKHARVALFTLLGILAGAGIGYLGQCAGNT
jgi:hypothetical protein